MFETIRPRLEKEADGVWDGAHEPMVVRQRYLAGLAVLDARSSKEHHAKQAAKIDRKLTKDREDLFRALTNATQVAGSQLEIVIRAGKVWWLSGDDKQQLDLSDHIGRVKYVLGNPEEIIFQADLYHPDRPESVIQINLHESDVEWWPRIVSVDEEIEMVTEVVGN